MRLLILSPLLAVSLALVACLAVLIHGPRAVSAILIHDADGRLVYGDVVGDDHATGPAKITFGGPGQPPIMTIDLEHREITVSRGVRVDAAARAVLSALQGYLPKPCDEPIHRGDSP